MFAFHSRSKAGGRVVPSQNAARRRSGRRALRPQVFKRQPAPSHFSLYPDPTSRSQSGQTSAILFVRLPHLLRVLTHSTLSIVCCLQSIHLTLPATTTFGIGIGIMSSSPSSRPIKVESLGSDDTAAGPSGHAAVANEPGAL